MAGNGGGGKKHTVNLGFATAMGIIVVAVDIIFLFLAVVQPRFAASSIAAVGILTFLAVLFILNYLSGDPAVEKGEVGHAFAAALFVVYFTIFSLLVLAGITPTDPDLAEAMIGHFTAIVQVVVGFYFGAEAAKFGSEKWEGAKKKDAEARIAEAKAREAEAKLELARLGPRPPPG